MARSAHAGTSADSRRSFLSTGKARFKRQTEADGTDVPPGSFLPGCGPWRLTDVMAFEVELFAQPFSTHFDAASFDRACEKMDGGTKLKLTPKQPIGQADMLKPAITAI